MALPSKINPPWTLGQARAAVNSLIDHLATTPTGGTDPEVVRDTIAAALVAGTGVSITPVDAANTITISATGGGGGDTSIQVGGTRPASGWWLDTQQPETVVPDTPVTPLAPTFTDASGTANDRYTVPSQTGVIYRVNGTVTAAGTYTPTAGQAVTITATAAAGYVLTGYPTTGWAYSFTTGAIATVTDTFDTADNTSQSDLAGRTTKTGNLTWAHDTGRRAVAESNGSLRLLNGEIFTTSSARACYVTAGQQNVRAKLYYHTAAGGTLRLTIAAKASGTAGNFRGIGIARDSSGAFCFYGTGGAPATLGTPDGLKPTSGTLEVEYDGTTVRGWHNGTKICEQPLAPSPEFGTDVAISHQSASPSWFLDNFEITYL